MILFRVSSSSSSSSSSHDVIDDIYWSNPIGSFNIPWEGSERESGGSAGHGRWNYIKRFHSSGAKSNLPVGLDPIPPPARHWPTSNRARDQSETRPQFKSKAEIQKTEKRKNKKKFPN